MAPDPQDTSRDQNSTNINTSGHDRSAQPPVPEQLLIPFPDSPFVSHDPDRPEPEIITTVRQRISSHGAPIRLTTRTISVPWRPPPDLIMNVFTRLVGEIACFEEYLDLPAHINLDYTHIESMWNYHMLTSSQFHTLYFKPTLKSAQSQTLYAFYYRHFPLIRQLMDTHTISNNPHLMSFYIGGSDRVLSMIKIVGPGKHDFRRPFVKLYAETIMFSRATQNTLLQIPRGKIRVLCFA